MSIQEYALLIYVLIASRKASKVFQVYSLIHDVKSRLTGKTLLCWLTDRLLEKRPFEGVKQIVFTDGAYGEVHYTDGSAQIFGERSPFNRYNAVDSAELGKLVVYYEQYRCGELAVKYGRNEA
ncbi:hypothetical protein [Cesiribacter andamanensis]|uniref:hypothetical protein n=1 Tax=Cesiribacter andamanensis TaxID=649507 RepID=UPI001268008E|nr:hypothetical protein [Cesiribacter andamanensis]